MNITLQFSQKQKAAEEKNNLFETSRSSYKDCNELVYVTVNTT
jgi:hypothetical protein